MDKISVTLATVFTEYKIKKVKQRIEKEFIKNIYPLITAYAELPI